MGRKNLPPVTTGYRKGSGYQVGHPLSRRDFASHLFMMHGVWIGTTETLKSLEECHRLCHEDDWDRSEIRHAHVTFKEDEEEWKWEQPTLW